MADETSDLPVDQTARREELIEARERAVAARTARARTPGVVVEGLVLKSPDGSYWTLTVDDDGGVATVKQGE